MKDCIFCRIINGSAPASEVYSDEKVIAIMDIQPVNPGHVLVIPKLHAAHLSELNEEIGGRMFKIAMRIAASIRHSSLKCEGINLWLADGEAAGQDVSHVHLHIIPRFRGDGLKTRFGPRYVSKPDRKNLEEKAEEIRQGLHEK